MKNLIFILLLMLFSAVMAAQKQVILTECEEPQTYSMTPMSVVRSNCQWEGTHTLQPSEYLSYPTIQVAALPQQPYALPLGYMTKLVNGYWKVYMHPFKYESIANPTQKAVDDGFCEPFMKVSIVSNPFPGMLSN